MCGAGGVTGRPGDPGNGHLLQARPGPDPARARLASARPCVQSGLLARPGGGGGQRRRPGACSSGSSPWPARLGSEDAGSALESRRGRPRSGTRGAGGPGRARGSCPPPGGRLGEPRGLASGLHPGERGRLTAQVLSSLFQSQLPNWERSGLQSGSLGASN